MSLESTDLRAFMAELDHTLQNLRREYNNVSSQLNYTLTTERQRFKTERSAWIDSFVSERFEPVLVPFHPLSSSSVHFLPDDIMSFRLQLFHAVDGY